MTTIPNDDLSLFDDIYKNDEIYLRHFGCILEQKCLKSVNYFVT